MGAGLCDKGYADVVGAPKNAGRHRSRLWIFAAICGVFLCLLIIGFNEKGEKVNTDSLGRAVPDSVKDDADLLIYRCGKPDVDDSTAFDNPRPLLPTRSVEYHKERIRFVFMPEGKTSAGAPPPYHWSLMGVQDTVRDGSLDVSTAVARMPCWKGQQ